MGIFCVSKNCEAKLDVHSKCATPYHTSLSIIVLEMRDCPSRRNLFVAAALLIIIGGYIFCRSPILINCNQYSAQRKLTSQNERYLYLNGERYEKRSKATHGSMKLIGSITSEWSTIAVQSQDNPNASFVDVSTRDLSTRRGKKMYRDPKTGRMQEVAIFEPLKQVYYSVGGVIYKQLEPYT